MLVLTRKKAQSIVIAGDVVVTVIAIRGEQVRLGVEAPREVPIHRQELLEPATRRWLVGQEAR
jgi:carbon storage regulator